MLNRFKGLWAGFSIDLVLTVVLYQPEIPPNTGNVIRLCANTGCQLHLIEPLGFALDDKQLRRAGLDYHEWANVKTHADYETFINENIGTRIFTVSTKHQHVYSDANFEQGDTIVFGPETRGLPAQVRESVPPEQRLTIPMRPNNRSLNLSNAVAIVLFEAWRQMEFRGAD